MKPALKKFVQTYHQFRVTGTDSTMRMVKSVIGDDSDMSEIFLVLHIVLDPMVTSIEQKGEAEKMSIIKDHEAKFEQELVNIRRFRH